MKTPKERNGKMSNYELAMREEMHSALTKILNKVQAETGTNSLSNQEPDRWLSAAAVIMAGGKPFDIRKQFGMHQHTANAIYGIVSTSEDAVRFREQRAQQLAAQIANEATLSDQITENLLYTPEGQQKVKEAGFKELQNAALSQKLLHEQFDRVTGNNVQRIEVKHITTPEEAMSLIDSLPEADVEEVTDI